jgi:predicted permease
MFDGIDINDKMKNKRKMKQNKKIILLFICSGLLFGLLIFELMINSEISWGNFYKNTTVIGPLLSSLGLLVTGVSLATLQKKGTKSSGK